LPEEYFSDRERGPRQRIMPDITPAAWGGIVALVHSRIFNGAFGADYPEGCPDGRGTTGTDGRALGLALRAEIPEMNWPLQIEPCPPTIAVLDLLEFCH